MTNTTTARTRTPLFRDLSDADLRTEYRAWRTAAYNRANIGPAGRPGSATRRASAAGMGRAMRNVEIIEAIADRRGIRL